MRIGIMFGGTRRPVGLEELVEKTRDAEARGFDTVWVPNVFGAEAVTTAALLGRATGRIEIGTAVVPTQPRHPLALAQQALTASAASGGRFTLGIGLSHPAVIEHMFGLSYERRAKHMREYMRVLAPLLRGQPAKFVGEEFRVQAALDVPAAAPVPVLIAALGDEMLKIAGRTSQGTILWMAGMRTIERHIVPKIREAAREAGRDAPRVVAGMHIALTAKPETVHARIEKLLAVYGQMPSYRAMLDIEGAAGPEDLALVGDERTLEAGLARLRDMGVSDFEASIFAGEPGDETRTYDFLASQALAGQTSAEP